MRVCYILTVTAFTHLGFGSCFMHGANTNLSGKMDRLGIQLITYLLYQESVRHMSNVSIIRDLRPEG